MSKRVAYLGPPGTYSEAAALKYDNTANLIPFPSITASVEAVRVGRAEEGVIPIENSLEGSVNDTLDLLIHETVLHIRRELVLPIDHCFLVAPGTKPSQVEIVYSHPQALGQCRYFLQDSYPNVHVVASLSTVAAVEQMLASEQVAAAIAPRRASELYAVEVLTDGIQDQPHNVTRFIILARTDHSPTGDDKTSLCFAFSDNQPGRLHEVLGEFASRGLNLSKVESRPTKESLGHYTFLVDVEGHRQEKSLGEALSLVERQASIFKVFGSYPRWRE